MESKFNHKQIEEKIAKMWEEGDYFKARPTPDKKPYTIVLPPPNCNGILHVGHALMVAIEDLLIRYKRLQGFEALWIPGTDHAGFETQVVFEKMLAKQGKSRFDFDSETLYKDIFTFTNEFSGTIKNQIEKLGASLDWSRYKFTLDADVIQTVYNTFQKLHDDGLLYKDDYIVNYSPFYGTTFADLEVEYIERIDSLYYIKYFFADDPTQFVTVATTRPEPIFVDTHLAINPKDERYKYLLTKKVLNPLTQKEMSFIEDSFVDMEFGTGIVKLTPAHDKNDFDVAKRHNLPIINLITFEGTLNELGGEFVGLTVQEARKQVVEKLKAQGNMEKINEKYKHSVLVDYKGNYDIEPMVVPNWFIKVASLKKAAHDAVKTGEVRIYPQWQETKFHRWMEDMHDWPISRQIVWGIRIPVWYEVTKNPTLLITFLNKDKKVVSGYIKDLLQSYSFDEIKQGLQKLIAPKDCEYIISANMPEGSQGQFLQETDTFDTWFSSGHWPLVCTGYPDSEDYKYFYPTDVLETGWEILRFWVSRMLMFGIYLTGKPPFKDVYLHGLVRAADGKKMSKSLGNQIDPLDAVEEFGADVLRMGLISGTANGKDFNFPKDKVIAYRNFANKIWNMERFMLMMFEKYNTENNQPVPVFDDSILTKASTNDKEIIAELNTTIESVATDLDKFRFADAGDAIYHFMWNTLASDYIEHVKTREDKDIALSILAFVYGECLKLLHPFMPFITEELWDNLPNKTEKKPLVVCEWPRVIKL